MKITIRDAIIAALEARGETRVTDNHLSKAFKYTRTWVVRRTDGGVLIPAKKLKLFWYVGKYQGSLRAGTSHTLSTAISRDIRDVLVAEGRAILLRKRA